MGALKLMLAFSPWLLFWIISSGGTMWWLKAGILVAAGLVGVMGARGLHKGLILWVGVVFFAFCLVSVVGMNNMWVVRHMGVIASGTLFASTFLAMLAGKPFTADYARQGVPPELWASRDFTRGCYLTTGVWCAVFLANTLVNWVKLTMPEANEWAFRGIEFGFLTVGVLYTSWYAERAKARRVAFAAPGAGAVEGAEKGSKTA